MHQEQSPARRALAPRGPAASHAAAARGIPQKRLPACCEHPSLKPKDGLACQCPYQVRRCSCHWAAKPPHHAALRSIHRARPTLHSTRVSVGGPTCIHPAGLPHCHCAGVGVESWVWCGRSAGKHLAGWRRTSRGCNSCGSRSSASSNDWPRDRWLGERSGGRTRGQRRGAATCVA